MARARKSGKLWLVVNEASGSNDQAAVEMVSGALQPDRLIRVPGDDAPDAAALKAAGIDTIAIFTGDGTANSVIGGASDWDGHLLMLPGGTTNLLSRALHGEATAGEILARYAAGELTIWSRQLIRCSQGAAHSEILVGPGAAWSDVRETLREGDVAGLAVSAAEAIQRSAGGSMVQLIQPRLGREEGYPAIRLSAAAAAMVVDGYCANSIADFLRQGVALLKRDFREGPHDELGQHRAIVCRSEEPVDLMIDGERRTGAREERIEMVPCAIRFLASQPAA